MRGQKCGYVYFPTGSFISLVAAVDERSRLEVGIVGDEGMLGTALVLGVNVSPLHALVQGSGPALRMDAAAFRRELESSAALRHDAALEAAACECYRQDNAVYDRILAPRRGPASLRVS